MAFEMQNADADTKPLEPINPSMMLSHISDELNYRQFSCPAQSTICANYTLACGKMMA